MTDYLDHSRRLFLQQMVGATGTALLAKIPNVLKPYPLERSQRFVGKAGSLDQQGLQDLENLSKLYWQVFTKENTISANILYNQVHVHFQQIANLLQTYQAPPILKRLYALASETARLAAALSFDRNNFALAISYYTFALDRAKELNDPSLLAVTLGAMSITPIYTNRTRESLAPLTQARKLAQQSAPPLIQAWLNAVNAEVSMIVGESYDCLKLLERAERAFEQITTLDDVYCLEFDRSGLFGYKGVCYLSLQKPILAQLALEEALEQLSPSRVRYKAVLLTDLASSYVAQKEIEKACQLSGEALNITLQTNSENVLRRVRDFMHQLEPWKDEQVVKELQEQLLLS